MTDQNISIDICVPLKWRVLDNNMNFDDYDRNNIPIIQLHEILELQQTSNFHKLNVQNNQVYNQSELSRIESKLDLLMTLYIREQVNKKINNIIEYNANLSFDGLKIDISSHNKKDILEINQYLEIQVFLSKNSPEPILLTGMIVDMDNADVLNIKFHQLGNVT